VEESQSSRPLSGWNIIQPNYQNNPRYFLLEQKAVFKKIRLESGKPIFTEMINEIICNSLGKRLGIPIVSTILGVLPTQGIGLFSILIGEQSFNPEDENLNRFSNIAKLKELFVFDQWIYNDDRKAMHIKTGIEPASNDEVLYAYDHGHTLNGYQGERWTIETLTDEVLKIPSQVLFDSKINNYDELKSTISNIKLVSDSEIDKAIGDADSTIHEYNVPEDESNKVRKNNEIIKKLLQTRRDFLDDIIKTWCKKNGKPCPEN